MSLRFQIKILFNLSLKTNSRGKEEDSRPMGKHKGKGNIPDRILGYLHTALVNLHCYPCC